MFVSVTDILLILTNCLDYRRAKNARACKVSSYVSESRQEAELCVEIYKREGNTGAPSQSLMNHGQSKE